jgi:hypothetical protein
MIVLPLLCCSYRKAAAILPATDGPRRAGLATTRGEKSRFVGSFLPGQALPELPVHRKSTIISFSYC